MPAESVKVNVADRVPAADGVKVTLTEQLPDPANVGPQVLLEMVKSDAFAPMMAMLLILIAAVLPLLSVTACAAVVDPITEAAKTRLPGATLAPVAVPVPERPTD